MQVAYQGRIFFKPFFLLLDSFWLELLDWLADAGCVLSDLLSVDVEEASVGALGSVGLDAALASVPDDEESPVVAALGSSVPAAGAGSPGFTTPTTPGLFVPGVSVVDPPVDAPVFVPPTSAVVALVPLRTSYPD